jgi:hypothetical protein
LLLLALAGAAPLAPPLAAQPSYRFITVRVVDAQSQVPLPGVQVMVQGMPDREWSTDDKGSVLIAVARDTRAAVQVRRMGYSPAVVPAPSGTNDTELRIAMQQTVTMLDTTKVVTDARSQMFTGFEGRRMHGGSATFISREQIEKQMAIRTIDVVRRAISTRVIDSAGILLVASSRGPKTIISAAKNDLAPCVMRVAVDGMLREWGFSLDGIEPKEIYGVEVYPGPATIPSEFSGMRKDAYCGLIMIWTRRGS